MIAKCLWYDRHCLKYFTCLHLFNPPTTQWVGAFIFLFYRWGNWGTVMLTTLLKIPQNVTEYTNEDNSSMLDHCSTLPRSFDHRLSHWRYLNSGEPGSFCCCCFGCCTRLSEAVMLRLLIMVASLVADQKLFYFSTAKADSWVKHTTWLSLLFVLSTYLFPFTLFLLPNPIGKLFHVFIV